MDRKKSGKLFTNLKTLKEATLNLDALVNTVISRANVKRLGCVQGLKIRRQGGEFILTAEEKILDSVMSTFEKTYSSKVLIRGEESEEDVEALIAGNRWGVLKDPVGRLISSNNKLQAHVSSFCIMVSTNKTFIFQTLNDNECEMSVKLQENDNVAIQVTGNSSRVEKVIHALEKKLENVFFAVPVTLYKVVPYPKDLVDDIYEFLQPKLVIYTHSSLYLVYHNDTEPNRKAIIDIEMDNRCNDMRKRKLEQILDDLAVDEQEHSLVLELKDEHNRLISEQHWESIEKVAKHHNVKVARTEAGICISPSRINHEKTMRECQNEIQKLLQKYKRGNVGAEPLVQSTTECVKPKSGAETDCHEVRRRSSYSTETSSHANVMADWNHTSQSAIYENTKDVMPVQVMQSKSTSGSVLATNSSPKPKGALKSQMYQYLHASTKTKVFCVVCDITKMHVDCIVNAANDDLLHCGGVAYAISRSAGPELDKESAKIIRENGPLKIADVKVTTAGLLPCQKVLHAVGPKWFECSDEDKCESLLQSTFYNCLVQANHMGFISIAFPAISSGIYGVPMNCVSGAAVSAIGSFLIADAESPKSTLKEIYLVDLSMSTIQSFNYVLSRQADIGIFQRV